MLLAIDTATHVISLAVHNGDDLLIEQTWSTENQHSVELAPAIETLLRRVGATPQDLTALAVSIGPGSYSGLRIGVALAKGVASVRGLPLIGVSSLDTLAVAHPLIKATLMPVIQAGRGRVIAQTYRVQQTRWMVDRDAALYDWDSLIQTIETPTMITGEIDENGRRAIAEGQARGQQIQKAASALRLRRAGFLAQEAWTRYNAVQDKRTFAADKLTPMYVKTKDLP